MRVVGLMKELEPAATVELPSLRDLAGALSGRLASEVVSFLRSGVVVIDVMEASPDPLEAGKWLPGGASLMSDGRWVWRKDLAYFVERYRVRLDDEFLRCVESSAETSLREEEIIRMWADVRNAYDAARHGGRTRS